MARITVNDVEEHYTAKKDQDLSVSIQVAQNWVDAILIPAGVSESLAKDIQTFLACGVAVLDNPRAASSSVRNKSVTHEGGGANRYFKMAIFLDPTGLVAKAFSTKGRRKAKLTPLLGGVAA
jgi:hypothetical protein